MKGRYTLSILSDNPSNLPNSLDLSCCETKLASKLFKTLSIFIPSSLTELKIATKHKDRIIPTNKEPMTIASIILDGSIWAIVAFWISLSVSKYIALLRCIVPIFILGLILTIIY